MKRSFLEGLGIERDTIDKILDENGKDLENAKVQLTVERDDLKAQLDKAQETLKGFDGVDVNDLKTQITNLTKAIDDEKAASAQKLADMQFKHLLESEASASGARNIKAVMALLDTDTLKASKNQEADIKAAFEAVKKDNDYLFASNEPIDNPKGVGKTEPGGNGGNAFADTMRAAMGLKPTEK